MNFDEKIVFNYLVDKVSKNVIFEPDGNIPPDFLIDSAIAVEARRLNQHVIKNGNVIPLESSEYKVIPKLIRLFDRFNSIDKGLSATVSISYRSPLRINQQIEKQILDLLEFKANCLESRESYSINNNLEFQFNPSNISDGKMYKLSAYLDRNWGGVVVSEVFENLKLCITLKERKIIPHLGKYQIWWLALVDYIGFYLNDNDQETIKAYFNFVTVFDKVILISPFEPHKSIVIKG